MSDFIDIYIDERGKKFSSFCPVCGGVLQSLEDTVSVYKHDACQECFVCFVEPNKLSKGSTWKPNKEEISSWLKKKKSGFKIKYSFF